MLHTSILVVCQLGIYQVSVRYSNAFKIRSANTTQKPLVSALAKDTESAIASIFSRPRQKVGGAAPASISLGFGVRTA